MFNNRYKQVTELFKHMVNDSFCYNHLILKELNTAGDKEHVQQLLELVFIQPYMRGLTKPKSKHFFSKSGLRGTLAITLSLQRKLHHCRMYPPFFAILRTN